MFHTLRKVLAVIVLLVAGLAGYGLSQWPGLVDRLTQWFQDAHVQMAKDEETKVRFTLDGRISKVWSGNTFTFATDQGASMVRLAGVASPSPLSSAPTHSSDPQTQASHDFLQQHAEGRWVTLRALSLDTNRWIIALADIGATNLNALVLQHGHGRLAVEEIELLPVRYRYQLRQAAQAPPP
ncbi:MAG TPA: hypothetical protein P5186_13290 [Candidatus Paceibacterota bacterium]|nr:hypothetical protein [Verrucomicrobiota bacterium]HRY49015.1 hypothetical protein [Candidatus Paceibacterota bacterium]HRZ99516.1 hypothetical protein [Candidatus Paceibacterota bacterium]